VIGMSRWQAFLIHLGISLTVFGAIAYCVIAVWYPAFFFDTDGGYQGLRILLGVDLVLGPLLTLIVYRTGKPGLRTDLTLIGTLQVACLAAGVWIVHAERPLAIAYVDGSFYTVTAQSFRELDLPIPNLDALPGDYPKWVTVKLPDDVEQQSSIRGEMLGKQRMLSTLSEHYVPFKTEDLNPIEARPAAEIKDRDRDAHALQPWLERHGGTVTEYRFFPFGGRYAYCYLGFDSKSGRLAGLLDVPAPT
jgi:hypothetical protein